MSGRGEGGTGEGTADAVDGQAVGPASGPADGPADGPASGADAPRPMDPLAVPSVAKPYRLQFERAQDAWVLLYPEGMVKLNRSAGETLSRCDGERRVEEVVGLLEEAFGRSGLGDDVRGFLGVARAQGWVSVADAAAPGERPAS